MKSRVTSVAKTSHSKSGHLTTALFLYEKNDRIAAEKDIRREQQKTNVPKSNSSWEKSHRMSRSHLSAFLSGGNSTLPQR